MLVHQRRFLATNATALAYEFFSVDHSIKAQCLIVHGMGEHGARYRQLGDFFQKLGIQSYAIDLRGFGRSAGQRAYVDNLNLLHQDLIGFIHFIKKQSPASPIFIFAHSFGALLTLTLLLKNKDLPVKGVVLSSPFFDFHARVSTGQKFLFKMLSFFLPKFVVKSGIVVDQLTNDKQIIKTYAQDPLINQTLSLRMLAVCAKAISFIKQKAFLYEGSILVMYTKNDKVVSSEAIESRFLSMKSSDKQIQEFSSAEHELIQSLCRDEVIAKAARWICERF